jgi:probable phosphoglycerate mutase
MESVLTPLGARQAAAMADLLHDLTTNDAPADWRIVSSPLGRARATAGIIGARLGLPVAIDDRLVEISVGAWEGRLAADIVRETPDLMADPEWHARAPGGERYDDVMARVGQWLDEQVEEDSRRLIVVSHGVSGRLLRGRYAGLTKAQTLAQDSPQDALYRLSGGLLERITCAPVADAPRSAEMDLQTI